TVVFRNANGSSPFDRTSGANATAFDNVQSPNPPALTDATRLDEDAVITLFGKNNDYGASVTAPSTYSITSGSSTWEDTAGTEGSSGLACLLDVAAGTTSDPGAWTLGGTSTDDGLTWTAAVRSNV